MTSKREERAMNNWETILASVTVEIGEHQYHAAIIRRGEAPHQTYYLMKGQHYYPFDGKGDDAVATSLGIIQMGLLIGRELDEWDSPKGPQAEQL